MESIFFATSLLLLSLLIVCWRSLKNVQQQLKWTENERDDKNQEYLLQARELTTCQTKLHIFEEGKQQREKEIQLQFENLANRIFDDKSRIFSQKSEKELSIVLGPLREQIRDFEKSVAEKYTMEAKERHNLKAEIEKLTVLNDKMTAETNSLVNALRGDSKIQGDWGEMVLERILESSGLRKGKEYELQKSYRSEDERRLRPDVIIHLPEGKQIIVDSKVSLTAYERYVRTGEEVALKEHLQSIKNHIKELGDKDYSRLQEVRSPEFVFMFMPIEPAYVTAIKAEESLSTWAWKKRVAVVTATTLLTGLKTVASIWRLEKQNRNAQKIADEGGKLYDKFVLFLQDFEKVGKTFKDGQKHYDSALEKLQSGRGNVFRKMEQLKELGAAAGKEIDQKFLD